MATKKKSPTLPSHIDFRQWQSVAHDMGAEYFDWDDDQLTQSAEYANDVLPTLRSFSGYQDTKAGTWTDVPRIAGMDPDVVADELALTLAELLEAFWEGYWTRRGPLVADEDEDDQDEDE